MQEADGGFDCQVAVAGEGEWGSRGGVGRFGLLGGGIRGAFGVAGLGGAAREV